MKINKSITTYTLESQHIDLISEKVHEFLESVGSERRNILRLRLSLEDILIKWQNHFGEKTKFSLIFGSKFGKPYINLELNGQKYNPLEESDEFSAYSSRMLSHMGLSPLFNYQNGKNIISIQLKRKQINPLLGLLIAIAGAFVIGFIGLILPEGFRLNANEHILTPLCDTFLNILSAIAGPLIFLSVVWGIYGSGDAATFGRIGKRVLFRYILMTFLTALVSMAVLMPFLNLTFAHSRLSISSFHGVWQLILDMFPKDIISPFINEKTLQINLIAFAVGFGMLMMNDELDVVSRFVEQANYIVQYLMEAVSNLIPASCFIILLKLIWSKSLSSMLISLKPLLYFTILTILSAAIILGYISLKLKISISLLAKKLFPTFYIAFTTASSSSAYGTNIACCERQLGIGSKLTNFGIPLGVAMYKPSCTMGLVACALCFAETYQVKLSLFWIVSALIIITIVSLAIPPIVGGAVTCYSIVFTQLGIPAEAITVMIILDPLIDFVYTGFNASLTQCELLLQASNFGMVKKEILRSDKKLK